MLRSRTTPPLPRQGDAVPALRATGVLTRRAAVAIGLSPLSRSVVKGAPAPSQAPAGPRFWPSRRKSTRGIAKSAVRNHLRVIFPFEPKVGHVDSHARTLDPRPSDRRRRRLCRPAALSDARIAAVRSLPPARRNG